MSETESTVVTGFFALKTVKPSITRITTRDKIKAPTTKHSVLLRAAAGLLRTAVEEAATIFIASASCFDPIPGINGNQITSGYSVRISAFEASKSRRESGRN